MGDAPAMETTRLCDAKPKLMAFDPQLEPAADASMGCPMTLRAIDSMLECLALAADALTDARERGDWSSVAELELVLRRDVKRGRAKLADAGGGANVTDRGA